ncbi:AI-2E family transporter [candidate division KSB1 bacterium]|nr:AI-2E family transporter [candidate division KSB1 bacterium]NIR72487.1 AI-2E family transporter [candidate division KSB1 bacterium]NIS24072.1 AI-2E family transporter [candidate division KSB1 bacterium]NIT70991.1 AI-2E family transporter [candidate division KSB1 bacterium]NIU27402.1 AI-2E family transporter [candidate division KSB1 bacterium]
MDESTQSLTIKFRPRALRKVAKWGLVLLLGALLLYILPILKAVFSVLIIALFLAFLLDPIVNFFENRGLDRLLALVLVFAMILLIAILGLEYLAPVISQEIQQMSSGLEGNAPGDAMQLIQEKLGDKIPLLKNPRLQQELQSQIETLLSKSVSMLVGLFSAVVSAIMVAFITFFFLKDGRRMKKTLVSWVPNRYFEMALIILHKTSTQLGRYLRGQLLVASIVGSLSILALYLLEIRYYFFIGAMAGLANMIPYFGPLVGAIPAIIIAFVDTGSFSAVVAVAVAFASIQLIENIFVSPFIVSKSVELHPLTIIIAILIGGQLWGIFGMLLAVPTASILKVTAQELYWGLKNYRIL